MKLTGLATTALALVGFLLVGGVFESVSRMGCVGVDTHSEAARRPQRGMTPANATTEDTAIVITSSWIPSHPSTYMIDAVLNSTGRLRGLSPTAPVFITVDHLRITNDPNALPADLEAKLDALEEYAKNLYRQHMSNPRMHVLPGAKHLHIGGSVMKALELIEVHYPSVRYVYYLQHDFYFTKDVDHSALVNLMDDRPDKVNYVLFPKRSLSRTCGDEPPIAYNRALPRHDGSGDDNHTLVLYPTNVWSDNNHLARLGWYREVLASLVFLQRAPEDPLRGRARAGCQGNRSMGLYLYHEVNIDHLDGRKTAHAPP